MYVDRTPSRYPRRGGPTCLTIVLLMVGIVAAYFLTTNAEEVIEAVIPTPTPEPTRTAESYALSASLYRRDGEISRAVESFETAIELDPTNVQYYIDLISLLTLEGDAENALLWAERVNVLEPNNDEVLTSVAAAYLLNGERLAEVGNRTEAELQYQKAVDAAQRGVQINPNNADAYAYQAGALISQNRDNFTEAQDLVDTALAINSQSATVHFYRAIVFETQGYYNQAIESYETARQLNPAYIDASLALAYSYFYTDNRQRAILVLRDLIEVNPNNADAQDALGWMYFLAGQYADAEFYLEQAVDIDPNMVRARAHLGSAYYKNFNYDFAIPELEFAVDAYDQAYEAGTPLTDSTSLYFNYLGFAYFRLDPTLCYVENGPYQYNSEYLFNRVLEAMGPDSFRGQDAQIGLEECRNANLTGG